mmetsp:Transcript_6950/g.10949  ORF Transcript_6950/g.10949 Transcript_6950/m.10949 type:complete len:910 (-) Transcript_6950:407-3136(-)|eukprot:CAMPEP_0184662342 /NCGR_PEP_ID=MMETSP0308-20130426/42813_1 /TAXON_ID=38269 /ORGANISM="Gloeochaete witrockiana, Strain SAG 46.84" /LENGTH=909 /DNA_ID=CAMNT_0027104301 /DNA_START=167 /DNA_END=2896 /DNA_ORIENTATION=-
MLMEPREGRLNKSLYQRSLVNLCQHRHTREQLLSLLLDIVLPSPSGQMPSTSSSSPLFHPHDLVGCQSDVVYARPESEGQPPPLVSRRALELLTHLAKNNNRVAVFLAGNDSPADDSKFPLARLIGLLTLPMYTRSSAHLEQLMQLLAVVVQHLSKLFAATSITPPFSTSVAVTNPPPPTDVPPAPTAPSAPSDETPALTAPSDATPLPSTEPPPPPRPLSRLFSSPIPLSDLRALAGVLTREDCSEATFTRCTTVLSLLCDVPANRSVILAELSQFAQSLAHAVILDLSELRTQLLQLTPPAKQPSESSLEQSTSSQSQPASGPSNSVALALLSSSPSTNEIKLLRILRTVGSLTAKDQSITQTDSQPAPTMAEELSQLDSLWEALSDVLSALSSARADAPDLKSPTPHSSPILSRLLPIVEAFFVVNKPPPPVLSLTPSIVLSSSPSSIPSQQPNPTPMDASSVSSPTAPLLRSQSSQITPPSPHVSEDMFTRFAEKHRQLLNAFIRQNPSLLDGSFTSLIRIPKLLDFDNKRAWFRAQLRKMNENQHYGGVRIHVRRSQVFEDSYHQLRIRSAEELKGRLTVAFVGEEGIDAGGVTREWYLILSREIFNPNYALFKSAMNNNTFQPNIYSDINPDHLLYFRFIGRIIGKAILDSQLLDAYFTRSFYKHMLNVSVTYHDMEAIDPEYYKSLKWILENDITNVIDHTFSAETDQYGKTEVVDLVPNGRTIPVTEQNKHEYVRLVCEMKMTTAIKKQITAFLEGFHELIPRHLIRIFNENELELLISGLPDIDIEDLRNNTEYTGYTASSEVIQWLWKTVGEFNQEEKARLLQFVTGTSKVPLDGFKNLVGMSGVQRFQIHRAYGSTDRLPSAHTCFNQLDLPEYNSFEQLRERLRMAIREGSEGFGFG